MAQLANFGNNGASDVRIGSFDSEENCEHVGDGFFEDIINICDA